MPEVDVTYSDVKFTKTAPRDNNSSSAETTYAEVKLSKQEDTKDLSIHIKQKEDVQQPRRDRKSKMSPAVLVVLISLVVLLAAAASGLVVFYITHNETLQLRNEIKMLKNLSESIDHPTCPPAATCPSCPVTPSFPTSGTTERLLPTSLGPPTSPPPTSPGPSTYPPTTATKNGRCLKCEAGWEKHGGSCYYFLNSTSSWTDSRRFCVDHGSDLVKIDSREEQTFLENRLRGRMATFWIGLTDSEEEGKWLWVDRSPLNQSFWIPNEPDDWQGESSGGEDCAAIGKEANTDRMGWYDQSCNRLMRSICEI